ncbi:ABC transporter substrate-binding protein [Rhodococcus sp. 27YEA15]|uniref:ABC transporter substrate-binding protein n=1 Tax=Rhodococcus sp. 27YEA15 TaxID=3156259 RepID=UPI003C7C1BE8
MLFDHNGFTVDIPEDPRRVMCLDTRGSIEFSLIAGYPMVAVRALSELDEGGVPNPVFARLDPGVLQLEGGERELSAEQAMQHDPDLLLISAGRYPALPNATQFENIAPVVGIDPGSPGWSNSSNIGWKEALALQLNMIGRGEQLGSAMSDYDDAVSSSAATLMPVMAGKKVIIATGDTDQFVMMLDGAYPVDVARELGLDVVTSGPGFDAVDGRGQISLENLALFDQADLIVMQNLDTAEAVASPTFQRVRAVQEKKLLFLPYAFNSGFTITGAAYARYLADKLPAIMAG